jgi:hypothetical protein
MHANLRILACRDPDVMIAKYKELEAENGTAMPLLASTIGL